MRFVTALLISSWFTHMADARTPCTDTDEVFICFEGKIRADQAELAGQFYSRLSELVKKQRGFISQTPFASIDQEHGQVLYVVFDSEQHLHDWKNNPVHLGIQAKGRADVFVDYRLRIGNEAFAGPPRCSDSHTTSAGRYLLLWQYPTACDAGHASRSSSLDTAANIDPSISQHLVDAATYVNEESVLRISSWPTKDIGLSVKAAVPRVAGDDLRLVRVERDYGRFQRGEAPGDADRCQAAAAANDTEALHRC